MLLNWLAVVPLAVYCLAVIRLAGWFDLAGWAKKTCMNWLPNLCLAGNPVTRVPDFVQPW
jgi:hypothetical protein